jgi:hypothetical protein
MVHILREIFGGFKNIDSIDFIHVKLNGNGDWIMHIVPIVIFKMIEGNI